MSTILHYGRAAIGNPRLALERAPLLAARLWRRTGMRSPRSLTSVSVPKGSTAQDCMRAFAAALPVFVLHETPRVVHMGLPVAHGLDAIATLQAALPDAALYAGAEPIGTLNRAGCQKILAFGSVSIAFQYADRLHNTLSIDFYEPRGNGLWVSLNAQNTHARALYGEAFNTPGTITVSDVTGGQSRAEDPPIDVVFTWVNHADPTWRALFDAHAPKPSMAGAPDGHAKTRFHDNGELRHALRALARYMPWVRKVHVVSNCAAPAWLNVDHPSLAWVDHADILDASVLPTFNSHAIETALHRVPDLAENFVYFNDDMFVCRPLPATWFFNANGTARAHMEPYGMVTGTPQPDAPDYLNAARNGAALMVNAGFDWPAQLHRHVPYALQKSVLREVEETFEGPIAQTRRARFRSADDVSLTSFLYHHYAWHTRRCTFEDAQAEMVKCTDLRWRAELAAALQTGCDVLCLNEGGSQDPDPAWRTEMRATLKRRFPWPAPWEATGAETPQ